MLRFLIGLVMALAMSAPGHATSSADDQDMFVGLIEDSRIGCAPDCARWIYARGTITRETVDKFAAIFKDIGDSKVPVILHSPGGSVEAAITIGEMIRERQLDIAVGLGTVSGCGFGETPCPPPPDGETYKGELLATGSAMCNSACPLILAGGTQRVFIQPTTIGVHKVRRVRSLSAPNKPKVSDSDEEVAPQGPADDKGSTRGYTLGRKNATYGKMRQHFQTMGVDGSIVALYWKAEPERIYGMKRAEVLRTRLFTTQMTATDFLHPDRRRHDRPPEHTPLAEAHLTVQPSGAKRLSIAMRFAQARMDDMVVVNIDVKEGNDLLNAADLAVLMRGLGPRGVRAARDSTRSDAPPLQTVMPFSALCRLVSGLPIALTISGSGNAAHPPVRAHLPLVKPDIWLLPAMPSCKTVG